MWNVCEEDRVGERRYGKRGRQKKNQRERNVPRVKCPPHLRGKQIGLFYRDITKNRPPSYNDLAFLNFPENRRLKIENLLNSMDDEFVAKSLESKNYMISEQGNRNFFGDEYLDLISVSYFERLNQATEYQSKNKSVHTDLLNEQLYEDIMMKKEDTQYNKMLEFRKDLPTYKKRRDIVNTVKENQVVVICGETGCGKTTQVGQMILEDACMSKKGGTVSIVVTQPRRIAATSVAARIASEQAETIGCSVGYSVRLDSVPPRPWGSVEVVTAGIVLQRLQKDPALLSITHLILDEIHERDTTCDILMSVAKYIMEFRKDFKLILMSATMEADRFCRFFGGCPMLSIPGLMFQVEEFYLEDALQLSGFHDFPEPPKFEGFRTPPRIREEHKKLMQHRKFAGPFVEELHRGGKYSNRVLDSLMNPYSDNLNTALVVELIRALTEKPPGAILVFLPGIKDISDVCENLQKCAHTLPPHVVYPLHSHLNSLDQGAIFKTPPSGVRKIIVSTNIAETSITIDDVVYVIDGGKIKMVNYEAETDVRTLQSVWVSKANALQRRGRAGRVQPGQCWHLFSRQRADCLIERPSPEIVRAPLHEPLLAVLLLRLNPPQPFLASLLDPPEPAAITNAITLLTRTGILDENEKLTPLGVHVARLPVAPGAARMLLLSSLLSAVGPVSSVAAVTAFKHPFLLPIGKEFNADAQKMKLSCGSGSDQYAAAEAQRRWAQSSEQYGFCRQHFLNPGTLQMLADMRKQFGDLLHGAGFTSSSNPDDRSSNRHADNPALFKAIVVAGLYPNVATFRGRHAVFTEEDGRVELHPSSVNMKGPQPASRIVYRMKQRSTKLFLHETSPAHPLPLLFFGDRFCISPGEGDPEEVVISCGGGKWRTKKSTGIILTRLRDSLRFLLQLKLQSPSPVDWNSSEGGLLTAIIELLSEEDDSGPSGHSRPSGSQ